MATSSPIPVPSSPSHSFIVITPPSGRQSPVASYSYSSSLPSPSTFFAKDPIVSVRGENINSVRNGAIASFRSASTLLPPVNYSDYAEESLGKFRKELEVQNRIGKAAKSKKLSIEKRDNVVAELKKDNAEKKRRKKTKGEEQTTIKKTKITKPISIAGKKTKLGTARKKAGDAKQIAVKASANMLDKADYLVDEEPLDLGLVEAVRRRRAWTPIEDTVCDISKLQDDATTSRALFDTTECANEGILTSGFENLIADYGYAKNEDIPLSESENNRDRRSEALKKRHKIEVVPINIYIYFYTNQFKLVNIHPYLSAGNSAKSRPRKKPQTITEKATAPFMPEEPASTSVLNYFGSPIQEANGEYRTEATTKAFFEANTFKRKPCFKPKKKSVTTKGPVLFSPKTAMKTTEDQELIFGTSSQLVRDESPILIEDMREAVEASRLMDEQRNSILPRQSRPSFGPILSGSSGAKSSFASSRNLWSVAARDLDGSLLNVEVIDLVDTPKPCKILPPSAKLTHTREKNCPDSALTHEPQPAPDSALAKPRLEPTTQKNPLEDMGLEQSIPRSLAEASLRKRPRSQSPAKKQKALKKSEETSHELGDSQMPNYEGFKTAELSKAVAVNGFKAIKKRADMISLLEQCWKSRNRISSQALAPSVNVPELIVANDPTDGISKTAIPVKKKKGRARKTSVSIAAVGDVNSITTAPAVNPPIKKPRGRPKKDASIPLSPKNTTKTTTIIPKPLPTKRISSTSPPPSNQPLTSHLSSTSSKTAATTTTTTTNPLLLQTITSAIKFFPPTHCATSLTFYEKILLYDPIVLEDLTVWLNTVGLGRVGADDEVGVKVVREWCLEQSVCFISREEGWRKKRKR